MPTGITGTPDNAADKVTVDGTDYYKPDSTVKLTINITSNDDFEKITGFKGLTANDDGTFDYILGTTLEFDGYAKIGSLVFDGTTNTYTINDATDLKALADYVNAGHDCAGTTFEFTRDISTSGTLNNFAGTIDGKAYKLINSVTTFGTLDNATISNLEIGSSGSAYGYSSVNGAGLATETIGNTTLSNITVSARLKNTSTDLFGGLVGKNSGNLTITGSKFSGYIESGDAAQIGGFVGENSGTLTITDGVFIPNGLDIKSNAVTRATFANGDNVTIDGSTYYATQLGTAQDFARRNHGELHKRHQAHFRRQNLLQAGHDL